jgi:signal transduction histidine kinase
LSISRSVAEAHGGQLVLEPTLTPGAAFVLRLPVAGCRLDGRPFKQESPA